MDCPRVRRRIGLVHRQAWRRSKPESFLKIICRFAGQISPCLWVGKTAYPRKWTVNAINGMNDYGKPEPFPIVDGRAWFDAGTGVRPFPLYLTRNSNPKGIATSSPGLRGTSHPGERFNRGANPDRVVAGARWLRRGKGRGHNPFRVEFSPPFDPG